MKDLENLLEAAGEAARRVPTPQVDVRGRVLASITQHATPAIDVAPLYFTAALVTLAASLCFAFLPSWQTMTEPWASYFVR